MPYFGNNPSPLLLNTVAQNGKEMTLDADADTSITADTDDQIDIKIGGSDIFQLTASKLDINGKELVLDADADTSITADTDDQIDIRIGGADDFQFTANTFTAQSGSTIAAQALTATTITASGIVKTDDTTEATSTTDGSLQTDGGLSVVKDAVFGDDVKLLSDEALLSFGVDGEVTLRHVHNTGLRMQDNYKFMFGDSDDLHIYHDGSNSYIDDTGTGSLFLRSNNIIMHKYTGENLITATADAEVNLYYNDSLKLTTTSNGVEIKNGASGQQPLLLIKDMNSAVVSGDEGGGLYWYTNDGNAQGNNLAIIQKFENAAGGAALAFETGSGGSRSERIRISASGYLHIGGTDSSVDDSSYFEDTGLLVIRRASSSNATNLSFLNAGSLVGRISTSTTATTYHTSSDYRLKENVTYDWDATSRLKQLKPARFNFKIDKDTTVDGFLAHEVSSIVPEAIGGVKDETQDLGTIKDKDGNVIEENVLETKIIKDEGQTWTKTKTEDVYQGIDQSKLVPLLVKTIQELEARITALEEA